MAISNFNKETLDFSKVKNTRHLENTELGLLNDYVIFIDTNTESKNRFIDANLELIKNEFLQCNKTFIYLPTSGFLTSNEIELLKYFLPSIECAKTERESSGNTETLLNYFYYTGNIKGGFIVTDEEYRELSFYELQNIDEVQISNFIQEFKNHYKIRKQTAEEDMQGLNSPMFIEYNEDDRIKVEDEIAKEIAQIAKQIDALKKKGLLVSAIPVLEKMTSGYAKSIDAEISTMYVDADYRILLKEFNLEIKLSHLTKSIYLLYLLHPEGFTHEEMKRKKAQLFNIYRSVSNQGDLEKLKGNIENLLADINSYYVHLSRIKSEFYKKMTSSVADNYIINGSRNAPKVIPIDRSKVNVKEIQKYFQI